MSNSDETRSALDRLRGEAELSKGMLLRQVPVVVHGDLATAHRVVIRVAEPSSALREEMITQSRLPSTTPGEVAAKRAKAEELTGRALADVLAESAALAAELGDGHAVVTAPTHHTPDDTGDGGEQGRSANAQRQAMTISEIPDLAASHSTTTLLFDHPDPRIAERLLRLVAESSQLREQIEEVVVVDGELLVPDDTADKVVAFPVDPHRRFELEEVSLNRILGRDETYPAAKQRPLIAAPESVRVRFVASDSTPTRCGSIASALLNPADTAGPGSVSADAVDSGSPLSAGQQAFLAELQTRRIHYVVTGVVALRLHAYAAGIDVPEWFSLRRYPTMEVALEPRIGNVEQGLAALHDLVEKGLIEPFAHPIPTGAPAYGQTANIVLLNAVAGGAQQRAVMVSYGSREIDSFPLNPVADLHAVVGELEIPIARAYEAETGARKKIETAFEADDLGPTGLLVLEELRRLVRAIDRTHKTRSVFPNGKVIAGRRSRLRFPRTRPGSDAS